MTKPISIKEFRRRHSISVTSYRGFEPEMSSDYNPPACHSSVKIGDKLRNVPERSLRRMVSASDMIVSAETYKAKASLSKAEQVARIASHEKSLITSAERKLASGDIHGAARLLGKVEANRVKARSLIDGLQAGTEFVSIQVSSHMGYALMPSDKPVNPCQPIKQGWNNLGRAKRYEGKSIKPE